MNLDRARDKGLRVGIEAAIITRYISSLLFFSVCCKYGHEGSTLTRTILGCRTCHLRLG